MTLGARLKILREEAGLTQVEVARAVGISGPYASLIEAGKRVPTMRVIEKWAETCGKKVSITFF